MADWTTSKSELRDLLSDNTTDNLAYRKKLFGIVDGANKVFKTFEKRRLTDLSAPTPSGTGAFLDGVLEAVTSDLLELGELTFTDAPAEGVRLEATYYFQKFLDSELDGYLLNATRWLQLGEDKLKIIEGLRPAALHYAGQNALHSYAMESVSRWSNEFMLEDFPEGMKDLVTAFKDMAKDFKEKATELRDDFYKRSGKANAPRFGILAGGVRSVVPKR